MKKIYSNPNFLVWKRKYNNLIQKKFFFARVKMSLDILYDHEILN